MTARVLAFEGWDSGSHRAIRESFQRHASLDWRFLTLPGRGPKWRLRHGAIELANRVQKEIIDGGGGAADVANGSLPAPWSPYREDSRRREV